MRQEDEETKGPEGPRGLARLSGVGRLAAVAIILALLGLMAWGLKEAATGPLESGMAPDFTLNTFEGETIRLSDLRGQVVVINIWASWCTTCREEAAYLESTWRKYRDRGVMFLGVDYVDTEPDALAYIAEFNITYPNGPDLGSRISQAYHMRGVPETYFVDKRGRLRGNYIGPLQPPQLDMKIEELLAESD
jgi:cytochrome c biogenesis protein CcmG/thiol:disulfide interchange protein DsbE